MHIAHAAREGTGRDVHGEQGSLAPENEAGAHPSGRAAGCSAAAVGERAVALDP